MRIIIYYYRHAAAAGIDGVLYDAYTDDGIPIIYHDGRRIEICRISSAHIFRHLSYTRLQLRIFRFFWVMCID